MNSMGFMNISRVVKPLVNEMLSEDNHINWYVNYFQTYCLLEDY